MLFVFDADEKMNIDALRARDDEDSLERLIRQNRRFILGCAYKTTRRFVTESDDEWSVALIAFHEAVMTYDRSRGNFRPFAALVIKRRLLDQLDSQSCRKNEITAGTMGGELSEGENAPAIELEAQRTISDEAMARDSAETAMRDEIEAMQQVLAGYGFSFFDLAACSPKAQKTKDSCARVIRALLDSVPLFARLRRTKTLPGKELCAAAEVSRKILENHRKYIIASAEILDGDYPLLAEYLRFVRKGAEKR